MTAAERVLAHFERTSEAPDAVQHLRRFVLALAVRGKIAEQQSEVESAEDFLQERASRLRASEEPWTLPVGWAWSSLRLLGESCGGGTPSKANPEFWTGKIPWVSPKDMKVDFIVDSQDHISEAAIRESAARLVPPGSLVMVVRGMILAHSFPTALTAVQVTLNQDMKALVPFRADIAPMLLLLTKGLRPEILRLVLRSTHGTCRLLTESVFSLPLPIPPLAEQDRIIAKVDELMALCDRLEAAQKERETRRDRVVSGSLARLNQPSDATAFREHVRFHLQHVPRITARPRHVQLQRETIRDLAVRGRLVPQRPDDEEEAAILMSRLNADIQSYRAEHGLMLSELQPPTPHELPFRAPLGWGWTRLSALFRVITDGDHLPPPKTDDGVAFLTIGNVTTGKLSFSGCRFVSRTYYNSIAPYRRPVRGDILYTVVGATFGRPALVDTDREFCVQRHIAILSPARGTSLRFLNVLLGSPLIYGQAARSVTGTAQPTIPLRRLRNFLVCVPPLLEQQRIVAKVDELMAVCDRLEAQLEASRAAQAALLEATLSGVLNEAEAGYVAGAPPRVRIRDGSMIQS